MYDYELNCFKDCNLEIAGDNDYRVPTYVEYYEQTERDLKEQKKEEQKRLRQVKRLEKLYINPHIMIDEHDGSYTVIRLGLPVTNWRVFVDQDTGELTGDEILLWELEHDKNIMFMTGEQAERVMEGLVPSVAKVMFELETHPSTMYTDDWYANRFDSPIRRKAWIEKTEHDKEANKPIWEAKKNDRRCAKESKLDEKMKFKVNIGSTKKPEYIDVNMTVREAKAKWDKHWRTHLA